MAQILIDYRSPALVASRLKVAVELLNELGYSGAVTGAIMPNEQAPFVDNGFEVREHLHVLSRSLHDLPDAKQFHSRRMRRADLEPLLKIDHESFSSDWQLDEQGIVDAKHATSHSRVRVIDVDEQFVAYAITGRTARAGYLQRLAVATDQRKTGIGTALVIDALQWLARRHSEIVYVNTQLDNNAAVSLYQNLDFSLEDYKLAILNLIWK